MKEIDPSTMTKEELEEMRRKLNAMPCNFCEDVQVNKLFSSDQNYCICEDCVINLMQILIQSREEDKLKALRMEVRGHA